jgi:KipI family sensor histidine kinase inhibitor
MKVRLAGDTMVLVEFEPRLDPAINQQAIALADALRARRLDGVRDVVPGYASVGVHFDPLRTDLAALERAVVEDGQCSTLVPADGVAHVIPVRYGGAGGPDLAEVAAHAGCSADEVIRRHAAVEYRVYMLGFVPGFAYLGRVDASIAVPRHRVPRERVPAGSVGIAGEQTGVYPMETPGGWRLIGRTDLPMFVADRSPSALLAPGDRVRFEPT